MLNRYEELKKARQARFNELPIKWAFNDEQFKEGMKELGLKAKDTNKVYSLGVGGFYRKSDSDLIAEYFKHSNDEINAAIAADKTGDGIIYDMFRYELANHEYGYTMDISETLEACGYTRDEINADERLLHGLKKACDDIVNSDIDE